MRGLDKLKAWFRKTFKPKEQKPAPVESVPVNLNGTKQANPPQDPPKDLPKKPKKEDAGINLVLATHDHKYKYPEENEYHKDLIRQYCLLRKSYKKNDPTYPEGLGIDGDTGAGFLLAVENVKEGDKWVPKVLAGYRLVEYMAGGGNIPVEKIEQARLESLFPDIKRQNHAVLNVDGAMFDSAARRRLPKAMDKLLGGLIDLAYNHGYDAVSFVPVTENKLDERLIKFYTTAPYLKEQGIPVVDYGTITRKGHEKRVLSIVIDHELMKLLPSEPQAKVLAYH